MSSSVKKIKGGSDFPPTVIELEKRPVLSVMHLSIFTSMLIGKFLTVLDASVTDPKQNKAAKDLIKTLVWSTFEELRKWCLDIVNKENKMQEKKPFPFLSGTPNDMLV